MPPTPISGLPNSAVRHAPPGWSDGQWRAVADRLNLSDRELEIVRGVLDDRKQSSIAAQLGISSHTVHTYLVRLYLKLHVSSRMELAMRVIGQFQTEPPPTASEPAPSFHSDAGEASRRERGNTPPT